MAVLSLSYCSSSDSGGGGGSGGGNDDTPTDPSTPVDPSAGPSVSASGAIYLWPVLECIVSGDMSGASDAVLCAPSDSSTGRDAAQKICENKYTSNTNVTAAQRNAINSENGGSQNHWVILPTATVHPRDFGIPNRDTVPVKRPDGTLIADSWSDFFDPMVTLDNAISGGSFVCYFNGLDADSQIEVTAGVLPHEDWTAVTGGVFSQRGDITAKDTGRFNTATSCADVTGRLLCATR